MTMKEKIRIHDEIEKQNRRKLKEWKEIREISERLAKIEIQKLEDQGIIA